MYFIKLRFSFALLKKTKKFVHFPRSFIFSYKGISSEFRSHEKTSFQESVLFGTGSFSIRRLEFVYENISAE